MTETEKKALAQAVAAAGRRMQDYAIMAEENVLRQSIEAHARAIEQHEAFRQEVSDAVEDYCGYVPPDSPSHPITRFIIAKPDPLVEALLETFPRANGAEGMAADLRAALAARGGRILFDGDSA